MKRKNEGTDLIKLQKQQFDKSIEIHKQHNKVDDNDPNLIAHRNMCEWFHWRDSMPFSDYWKINYSEPGQADRIMKAQAEIDRWLTLLTQPGPNRSPEVMHAYRDTPPTLDAFMLLLDNWAKSAQAEAARHAGKQRHKRDAELRAMLCAEWACNRKRYKSRAAAARDYHEKLQNGVFEMARADAPTVRTIEVWLSECGAK